MSGNLIAVFVMLATVLVGVLWTWWTAESKSGRHCTPLRRSATNGDLVKRAFVLLTWIRPTQALASSAWMRKNAYTPLGGLIYGLDHI